MSKLVLGIDGGGTKTELALATREEEIVERVESGPASLRNEGIDEACRSVVKGFKKLSKKPAFTFVGFPAFAEEYNQFEKKIKNLLNKEIPGRIEVGSDQLVAFKSGTNESVGVVLIAGTGAVARVIEDDQPTVKTSGWGWLADEGSAFWVGMEVYRRVMKELDGRMEGSLMTEMLKDQWEVETGNEINEIVYSDFMKRVPKLSIIADKAAKEGGNAAKKLMIEAGRELGLKVKKVIEKSNLRNGFPLVLVGGMFKSGVLVKTLKEEIKEEIEEVEIKKPDEPPVTGAVKLAIKGLKHE